MKRIGGIPWTVIYNTDKLLKRYKQGGFEIEADDPMIGLALLDELIDEKYDFIDLANLDFEEDDDNSDNEDDELNEELERDEWDVEDEI